MSSNSINFISSPKRSFSENLALDPKRPRTMLGQILSNQIFSPPRQQYGEELRQIRASFITGLTLFKEKRFEKAIGYFIAALHVITPFANTNDENNRRKDTLLKKLAYSHFKAGISSRSQGKFDKAIEHLNEASKLFYDLAINSRPGSIRFVVCIEKCKSLLVEVLLEKINAVPESETLMTAEEINLIENSAKELRIKRNGDSFNQDQLLKLEKLYAFLVKAYVKQGKLEETTKYLQQRFDSLYKIASQSRDENISRESCRQISKLFCDWGDILTGLGLLEQALEKYENAYLNAVKSYGSTDYILGKLNVTYRSLTEKYLSDGFNDQAEKFKEIEKLCDLSKSHNYSYLKQILEDPNRRGVMKELDRLFYESIVKGFIDGDLKMGIVYLRQILAAATTTFFT